MHFDYRKNLHMKAYFQSFMSCKFFLIDLKKVVQCSNAKRYSVFAENVKLSWLLQFTWFMIKVTWKEATKSLQSRTLLGNMYLGLYVNLIFREGWFFSLTHTINYFSCHLLTRHFDFEKSNWEESFYGWGQIYLEMHMYDMQFMSLILSAQWRHLFCEWKRGKNTYSKVTLRISIIKLTLDSHEEY